ncbi:exonuclease domain-containing protein [Paenibacillus yanchengensis]|uniref:Exonuclease domain-containing protein n=1 Tax=Paenibacillus yanchengensis TaxID=2035833 RepID=A0ABW4YIM7_9BACL
MDYIILDIEFNGRKFASDLPMEVIEIGAVRLNEQLQLIDQFSALIKPVYFAKLNKFIQKKTGILQTEIDEAERFPKVINDFQQWLAQSESCLFITWGGEDMKRIVLDTRMHRLDDQYFLHADYFDLLKGFIKHKGLVNDISVENALVELQIEADGHAHRALDDARMTSEIFKATFEHLDFSQIQQYKDSFTNAKERRLIKNAIRLLLSQKLEPTWPMFEEHFLQKTIKTDNPKKTAEIKQYFLEQMTKQKNDKTTD